MANLESEADYVTSMALPNENSVPMGVNEDRRSIHLNRGLMENSHNATEEEPSDCVSSSLEAEKTTNIGK